LLSEFSALLDPGHRHLTACCPEATHSLGVLIPLEAAVRSSEALDSFDVKAVNGNRNDPWIAAVQPLQVSLLPFIVVTTLQIIAREPDRIISMELCFHGCVTLLV
jgi:hypothetical protein